MSQRSTFFLGMISSCAMLSLATFFFILPTHATDVTINTTVPAICGNGFVEGTEQCDGNALDGASCATQGFDGGELTCANNCEFDTSACTNGGGGGALPPNNNVEPNPPEEPPQEEPEAICGNGILEPNSGEQCDDGNNDNGDGCDFLCQNEQAPQCGNAILEAGEQCDDGNNFDDDGCDAQCVLEEEIPPEEPDEEPAEEQPEDNQEEENNDDPQDNAGDENGDDQNDQENDNQDGDQINDPDNNNDPGDGGGGAIDLPSITRDNIHIFLAQNTIATLAAGQTIHTLPGDTIVMRINAPENVLEQVERITMQMDGMNKRFVKTEEPLAYQQSFFAPQSGSYQLRLTVTYTDGRSHVYSYTVTTHGYGKVSAPETPEAPISITLLNAATNAPVPMGRYGQTNPFESVDGFFGFVVPNGEYILQVSKDGYHTRTTPPFSVSNHVVNQSLSLIKKEPSIQEQIDPEAPRTEQAKQLAGAVGKKVVEQTKLATQKVVDTAKKIDQLADDPQVEKANEQVIVPTTAAVATATVVPSLWSTLLPLLRYVFLQPLLLLGRRKRKEWGTIYNSLTKLPIDLAMVRLIDAKTNRVVQSRVTDDKGRFLFITNPGSYTIEVTKQGFQFPSSVLKTQTADGKFADIYHGETIEVTEDGVSITPNVPVDPANANETPKRIVWQKRLRALQHVVAMGGIIFTAISLYISPTPLVAGFLILHIILYALFVKYAKPKKPKGWGIVYDEQTNKPLANAVVRLFTKEYNKLVSTQITDEKGRYAFLVGPNTYVVQSQKDGYRPFTSDSIEVPEQKEGEGILKPSVGLEPEGKSNGNQTTS